MQVDGGRVRLLNKTMFSRNWAPAGGAIHLVPAGSIEYELPAPPGRYLFIPQGDTLQLQAGGVELDFPYACAAGVMGGISTVEQTGPGCAGPW